MNRFCPQCSAHFEITEEDLKFYDKVSPVFRGKKYLIPPPTLCPDCRQQRRLAWRNERKLYKRKCDLCGKEIISIYHTDHKFPVYCPECWWSDKWDASEYGQDFDFSHSFFDQFLELSKKTPHPSLLNPKSENCAYTNHSEGNKNCYLSTNTGYSQNCFYCSNYVLYSKDCIDCLAIRHCDLCIECVDCERCYDSLFLQNCIGCHGSAFLFDCQNCQECIGCWSLRRKKYCIFNQQLTQEEYFAKKESLKLSNFSIRKKFTKNYRETFPKKIVVCSSRQENTENCSGDHILQSKNTAHAFFVFEMEDCRYCFDCGKMKDCIDITEPFEGELCCETHACNDGYQLLFCSKCYHNKYCSYSHYCWNCQNLFGCIGLRHKKYCILNKQYTKEEYERLVPKIIEHMQKTGEWGEFFPVELSPFAYNETVSQEYFPLTKQDVGANCNSPFRKNWKWRDEENTVSDFQKIIPVERLPERIQQIPDDILNWAIKCERTGRLFKIQKPELEFYRKMNLPIPHLHPDERHKDRMALRNPRKLWKRKCDNCRVEIETSYSPDRPEKVFCEKCYLEAVV
jgi:Zn ribbon nucleic-acid-binding protein